MRHLRRFAGFYVFAVVVVAAPIIAWATGSLTMPHVIANLTSPAQLSNFDDNFTAAVNYINAREITSGLLGARPVAGTAGRWYFATDASGGTLYFDTGASWTAVSPGLASVFAIDQLASLTMINVAAATATQLNIAPGVAASDDAVVANRVLMTVTTDLVGTTAATWVVGTGQPKLDVGVIAANTTYHVFLIQRTDSGAVDILFSTSPTSPTLPAGWTKKRRIGSFLTDGNPSPAIRQFVQDADTFELASPTLDNSAAPGDLSAHLVTLHVPTGINVMAMLNTHFTTFPGVQNAYISDPATPDWEASSDKAPLSTYSNNAEGGIGPVRVRTNTSAQVRYRTDSTGLVVRIATLGWIDRRGR